MSALTRVLFPAPDTTRTTRSILRWWESRRLTFNAFVGGAGLVTLGIVSVAEMLPPAGNFLPPLWPAIIIYAVLANACYSLGFLSEAAMQRVWKDDCPVVGPALFRQGLIFAVGLTLLPILLAGIDWGIRVLKWIVR